MSQLEITKYLNELSDLKKVSGSTRESVVREAFKDLLKAMGRAHDLVFIPEHHIVTAAKTDIFVDGALLYDLRLPFGYWEAKDEEDDLDEEIAKKFLKGYPQDNIIFEDSLTAVLIQNKHEAIRCDVDDTDRLATLLDLFFDYQRPEIAEFRKAVAQFQTDLPAVLKALREMIEKAQGENAAFRDAAVKFLKHAQETINPAVTAEDVREMLIQHILTEEIFSKVFDEDDFHRQNNVAKELYALEGLFFTGALKKDTLKGLEPYYNAIRATAHQISTHNERQKFLKVIYEGFYKVYNKKAADRLGVVYTPTEIVRFMVESADWLCERHFGKSLIDRQVEILDPAAGTGTFICELLEHFRGQPQKLAYKYKEELHANEVAILPYYVANLNIEATYAAIAGQYAEFPNLCFVDTLDNVAGLGKFSGHQEDLFGSLSEENVARIKRQNARKISVIIGNPPYNANQQNENDNNKNRTYPRIDERIKATYIAESTAQKTKAYDMYTRFFRWASDRLNDDGIIAFITNRSFIDSRTMDGFRRIAARDFAEVWVVDLGGDVRANPKLSGTKNNVFGIQTGVAISFLVKRESATGCRIFYARRPEMETRDDKLAFLDGSQLSGLVVEEVRPDAKANWINQTENDFGTFVALASKETKAAKSASSERAIFKLFSLGVVTARDEWVYAESKELLEAKIKHLIGAFNADSAKLSELRDAKEIAGKLDYSIKWTRAVKRDLRSHKKYEFDQKLGVVSIYRPFHKLYLYFSSQLNEMIYQQRDIFGWDLENCAIVIDVSGKPFSALCVDKLPDYHVNGDGICFPLLRYAADGSHFENITDWALNQFRAHYEPGTPSPLAGERSRRSWPDEGLAQQGALKTKRGKSAEIGAGGSDPSSVVADATTPSPARGEGERPITKDAIFHYVYAVLHDPIYREKYAQNLKREFPRIPFYEDFWRWADWGETLMALHIGYETVEPWPLVRTDVADAKAAAAGLKPKPILRADHDHGIIVLDSETQLSGVPAEAWAYRLGNRSALEWILDQHKEKTPKDPTIREKFNTYRFADYKEKVVDLLARVTRVSVETMKIVETMRATHH
ncbi:MAG: type ISP restriction/modification enzyme [Roseiarcus sp.]